MGRLLHLFLYVLQQERRSPQIVHRDVEEALNFLLMEVHSDQVGQAYTTYLTESCAAGLIQQVSLGQCATLALVCFNISVMFRAATITRVIFNCIYEKTDSYA